MKVCNHCNSQMEDNASFCPACGQRADTATGENEARNNAMNTLRRNLRHERKCWTIFGWVYAGIGVFFVLYCMLVGVIAAAASEEILVTVPVFLIGILYSCLLFLPVVLINLIMANKITGYLNQLETDPAPAVERCGGVWLIVMGALFNTVAMIFIILNFVHVKSNSAILLQK